jgi:hypothetical protein
MLMNQKPSPSVVGLGSATRESDPTSAAAAAAADVPRRAARAGPVLKAVGIALVVYAAVVVGLGMYWTRQPPSLDVAALQAQEVAAWGGRAVPGTAVVAAAIGVAESMLNKPGGLLYNDVMPPGVYLDNMPNWEYGALKELRDSVRALRNDFSRSQTQSIENDHVRRADVKFAIDASSWMFPAAEEEYRQGVVALRDFMRELSTGQDRSAKFFARADNLAAYLAVVEKRLGSLAVRLSSSVGDQELTAALVPSVGADGDPIAPETEESRSARKARDAAAMPVTTPWNQVDDIFYEARGYTWALLQMMKAIQIDFGDVLAAKNADVSIQQIVRDLEGASKTMASPIVLNGHGYGLLANHSLVMASYIARANAAVLDLRILMQQG